MQRFSYSDKGLALTKSFEGTSSGRRTAIAQAFGRSGTATRVLTVCAGRSISEAEADELLRADLAEAVACVNHAVQAVISQSQFDAMVDFCFNAGRGNFVQSTLLRKVNLEDFAGAAAQFALWVHAGGEVVPGLVRRRKTEAALFTA